MTNWSNIIEAVANNEITVEEAAARYNANAQDIMDGVEDYNETRNAYKYTPAQWFNSSCVWR